MPVSSSAQLDLVPWLLGGKPPAEQPAVVAALHAGSCVGIAWALRRQIAGLSRRDIVVLGLTSLPAAAAGLVVSDRFEHLWSGRRTTAGLLAASGAALWLADRRPRDRGVDSGTACLAALAQVVALGPGVSRSGATLIALRARRVRPADAQDFALLMSLPVTAGAALLRLRRVDRAALRPLTTALAAGVPVAAVTAAAATKRVRRSGGAPVTATGLYRLLLAAAVVARTRTPGAT